MTRMTKAATLATAVLLFDIGRWNPAQATLYGTLVSSPSGDSALVTIDLTTGQAAPVGTITGFPQVNALAARADLTLFGGVGNGGSQADNLLIINPSTGAGTLVGNSGTFGIYALAFSSGGTLYASCVNFSLSDPDTLCTINQTTGAAAIVGAYDAVNPFIYVDALAFSGSTLYASTRASSVTGPALYTVNPSTGAATLVAKICTTAGCPSNTQISAGVVGLAFVGATLYGSTSDGHIITLDPATGLYTPVGSIGLSGAVQDLAVLNLPGTATATFTPSLTPTQTPTLTPSETPTQTPTPIPPCSLPAPDNPCSPGGGSLRSDCTMEWLFTPVPFLSRGVPVPSTDKAGIPRNRLICYEGDPRCDFDPDLTNQSCTLHTAICINNTDLRLASCTATDIDTFEVKVPNPARLVGVEDQENLNVLEGQAGPGGFGVTVTERTAHGTTVKYTGTTNSTQNLCGPALDIVVPESQFGTRVARGRKTLRIVAHTSSGQTDTDVLRLECRPSTCGDGELQTNHETCDDGNRANGDGCNQACQVEPGWICSGMPSVCIRLTPTPTTTSATATPTATPTATAPLGPTGTPTQSGTATPTGPTPTPSWTGTPTNTVPAVNTPTPTPTRTQPVVITPNVCGNGTPEPGNGESCDTGGTCIGGANAGTHCVTETQCIGNGVCDVGVKYGTHCASSADCGGARCIHCKTFGGGGCAANCTTEKDVAVSLVPGAASGGVCTAGTSCARLHASLTLALPLNGTETLTIGAKGSDNNIPFIIKANTINLARVPVASLACACVRGIAAKTCGGYLFESNGAPATDCTFGDTCAASGLPPCAYVNGPGNAAAGVVGCGSTFSPVNVATTQDAGGVAIPPPPTPSPVIGLPVVTLSGSGAAGSAIEINSIRLGQVQSTCQGAPGFDPAYYGPDGQFCTADDPDTILARGPVSTVVAVTGVATATLTNSGTIQQTIGPDSTTGNEFTCRKLTAASPSASGSGLASAFTVIGSGLPGSGTITDVLFAQ
jgi:cysteine-rich repeat protein